MNLLTFDKEWAEYLHQNNNSIIDTVLTCVDSGNSRIAIQSYLPRRIFNAWTQTEDVAVSRHMDFVNEPCLACLYLPSNPRENLSEEIAENLNLEGQQGEFTVRQYLARNLPLDDRLLRQICNSNNVAYEQFSSYIGSDLRVFYSDIVCGGVLLRMSDGKAGSVEAPCAFESAFAGILLAAELIKDANDISSSNTITRFNLLRPIHEYINTIESKHISGRCICQDPTYINSYNYKWKKQNMIAETRQHIYSKEKPKKLNF